MKKAIVIVGSSASVCGLAPNLSASAFSAVAQPARSISGSRSFATTPLPTNAYFYIVGKLCPKTTVKSDEVELALKMARLVQSCA